jgi:hypothetical protein
MVSTIIRLLIQNILLLLTFVKIVEIQTSQLVQSYLLSQPFIGLLLEFHYYYYYYYLSNVEKKKIKLGFHASRGGVHLLQMPNFLAIMMWKK